MGTDTLSILPIQYVAMLTILMLYIKLFYSTVHNSTWIRIPLTSTLTVAQKTHMMVVGLVSVIY